MAVNANDRTNSFLRKQDELKLGGANSTKVSTGTVNRSQVYLIIEKLEKFTLSSIQIRSIIGMQ